MGKRGRKFFRVQLLNGKGFLQPRMDTAGKRPDPRDSHTLQKQRRTGASNLTRSITAQNNIAVTGNLVMLPFQLFKREGQGAGDDKRVR